MAQRLTDPGYIYVASSWRNNLQDAIVAICKAAGFEVYDFKNPAPGDNGFHWSEVTGDWKRGEKDQYISADTYIEAITHPVAKAGFAKDMAALERADTVILVLPCGKSAHLELGWACGAKKNTAVFLEDPIQPELMYGMVDFMTHSTMDLLDWLGVDD